MEKTFKQIVIDKLRNIIPLSFRKKIGPFFAYITYIFNIYILKNKKQPKVLSIIETIDLINKMNLSVIRFGDGEMSLMDGVDLAFQKYDSGLAQRLVTILQTKSDKLLICIPGIWKNINSFNKRDFWFFMHHLFRYRHTWLNLLSSDQIYGNTFVTRPYLTFKDKSKSGYTFDKILSIWKEKDIVLIEGEKSRLGVGNDLFNNVKSFKRILCPSENAFSKYNEIKAEAVKIDKNKLILISLGPTAKVLAFDLFLLGYRVVDIGHIDMEYEMFLKKETKIIKVRYKYFNEISERNPEEYNDKKYLDQIITKII
ncbi:MAG: SP_1767 family glycosyltransferase [Minisyncoccia bacterium]